MVITEVHSLGLDAILFPIELLDLCIHHDHVVQLMCIELLVLATILL
jgi:NADH:ubiquinone oxidoreductase subunit K